MKKLLSIVVAFTISIGASETASAEELISHNFDDGNLAPFNACSVKSPNYTVAENGRVKTYWQKSGYDGSRSMRGAELCGDEVKVLKHGWYGATIRLGSDYQQDKQAGIAQIFQFASDSFWSWAGMIDITNGDLTLTHRSNGGSSTKVEVVLYPDFPIEQDMDLVIGFTLSQQNEGEIQVWVNGESRYHITDTNFGYGSWNGDEQDGEYTFVTFKAGQYNYQAADYDEDETETVYYDNLTWYNGPNGYDLVDPAKASSTHVSMRKVNSSAFAIDGNHGATNAQNVYLWSYDANNKNQHWQEIDRGNGYYSYKKYGTNYCLDGNNGGENGQSVYLWECTDNNRNQHWKKVQIGTNYRLEKRNAPGFSIDGNNGGADAQDLYLWGSSDTNKNQQWIFNQVD